MKSLHEYQHGTAIVVSAGISICKLLLELGIGDVVMVDRKGILAPGEEWMNPAQKEIAEKTNKEQLHGDLKAAMKGRDIFVGVSAPNIVTAEMVSTIAELISDEELSEDNIIPKAFDKRVGPAVAKAVAEAARKTGVARK